ncbi:MAG TPA: entericidin A/B family lipoprotein [Clostridia bacterium]|nr:entericidin A/B family lipoprotein [Clostridia bacterium]
MIKRLLITVFAAAVMALAVTGCNTVEGAGEDIEDTGEVIQDSM